MCVDPPDCRRKSLPDLRLTLPCVESRSMLPPETTDAESLDDNRSEDPASREIDPPAFMSVPAAAIKDIAP